MVIVLFLTSQIKVQCHESDYTQENSHSKDKAFNYRFIVHFLVHQGQLLNLQPLLEFCSLFLGHIAFKKTIDEVIVYRHHEFSIARRRSMQLASAVRTRDNWTRTEPLVDPVSCAISAADRSSTYCKSTSRRDLDGSSSRQASSASRRWLRPSDWFTIVSAS